MVGDDVGSPNVGLGVGLVVGNGVGLGVVVAAHLPSVHAKLSQHGLPLLHRSPSALHSCCCLRRL